MHGGDLASTDNEAPSKQQQLQRMRAHAWARTYTARMHICDNVHARTSKTSEHGGGDRHWTLSYAKVPQRGQSRLCHEIPRPACARIGVPARAHTHTRPRGPHGGMGNKLEEPQAGRCRGAGKRSPHESVRPHYIEAPTRREYDTRHAHDCTPRIMYRRRHGMHVACFSPHSTAS